MRTEKTYWLFGSEACKAYREYNESSLSSFKPFILKELALTVSKEDFGIHFYNPKNENPAGKLLSDYSGWRDYEQISKNLYQELEKL